MNRTVVLLRHGRDEHDDLAARFLTANGFVALNVYPVQGEALPDPDDPALSAAIVYGGLESANDSHRGSSIPTELAWIEKWLGTEKPYFGVCLGAQMLAKVLGARVTTHPQGLHEVGYTEVQPTSAAASFLAQAQFFYQWHKEAFDVPADCRQLAGGDVYANQAFVYRENVFGVQFHPEVTEAMLRNWLGSSGHLLTEAPGVHAPEKQLRDVKKHMPAVKQWLNGFLRDWLGRPSPLTPLPK